jgi:DNA-binding GntR family transcriptional regulator
MAKASKSKGGPADPVSAADRVAAGLRDEIMQGRLKSEQPLKQDEIAARYGVSKIPVREALSQLKAEGLISFHTNRGAFISPLSPAEVEEIYLMRVSLETAALERAIPHLTVAEMVRAEGLIDAIDHEQNLARWGKLNWDFHATLYRPADLPRVMDTLQALHASIARYLVIYLAGMDYQRKSQQEHREILEACRRGDIDVAKSTLFHHLESASKHLIEFLNQSP